MVGKVVPTTNENLVGFVYYQKSRIFFVNNLYLLIQKNWNAQSSLGDTVLKITKLLQAEMNSSRAGSTHSYPHMSGMYSSSSSYSTPSMIPVNYSSHYSNPSISPISNSPIQPSSPTTSAPSLPRAPSSFVEVEKLRYKDMQDAKPLLY